MTIEKKVELTAIEKRDKELWAKLPEEKKIEVTMKLFPLGLFAHSSPINQAKVLDKAGKYLPQEYIETAATELISNGLGTYPSEDRMKAFVVFGKYNVYGRAAEIWQGIPHYSKLFQELQEMYSNRPEVVDKIHNPSRVFE